MPETPQKLFYKIGEVARLTGLPAHVLRYWESEFPQLCPAKGAGGQRRYRPEEVALVQTLQRLLHEERLTIEGARQRLREQGVQAARLATADTTTAASDKPVLKNTREGLRELLDFMDNTGSFRTGSSSDSGRGAVR